MNGERPAYLRVTRGSMVLACAFCACQVPAAGAQERAPFEGTISGKVLTSTAKLPVRRAAVTTHTNTKIVNGIIQPAKDSREIIVYSDEKGEYKISGLTAGAYHLNVVSISQCGAPRSRDVVLDEASAHVTADFLIIECATVRGRVVDQNDEPAPGITVLLVDREYFLEGLTYPAKNAVTTNDMGEYWFPVEANRSHLLFATRRERKLNAISDEPDNPDLRRRVAESTYFGGAVSAEGAEPVVLRPGEVREGVDIRMRRGRAYCLEGRLEFAGHAQGVPFTLELTQPSVGLFAEGGLYLPRQEGATRPDGSFRICGLHSGTYRLETAGHYTAASSGESPLYAVEEVTIQDKDLRGIRLSALAGANVVGRVVADPPPNADEKGPDDPVVILLHPLHRLPGLGEGRSARTTVSGQFRMPRLPLGPYWMMVRVKASDYYVKDIKRAGISLAGKALRIGEGLGDDALTIEVGRDGGKIAVKVVNDKGAPQGGMTVVFLPERAASEAELAAALSTAESDGDGRALSGALAPGEYRVAVTRRPVSMSVESVGELWRNRVGSKKVTIGARAVVDVVVEVEPD